MREQSLAAVKKSLGRPAYEGERALIYEGDCSELLRRLPAGSIDLTITSPPYNIGKEYESLRELDDYVEWCAEWIALVHRACASSGAFWLNLGYLPIPGRGRAIPIPYLLWDRIPFFLIQEIVWHYSAGVAAKRAFSPRNEKFLWFVRDENSYYFDLDSVRDPNIKYPNQFKNGRRKVNLAGKNPSDVWVVPKVTSGRDRSSPERTAHPAQFPRAVVDRILKACSSSGSVVLDPFLGSGTVAEAAEELGRLAVGFEIDAGYVGLAVARLEAAHEARKAREAQLSLVS